MDVGRNKVPARCLAGKSDGPGCGASRQQQDTSSPGAVARSAPMPISCAVGEIGQVYFSGGPEFAYHNDPGVPPEV